MKIERITLVFMRATLAHNWKSLCYFSIEETKLQAKDRMTQLLETKTGMIRRPFSVISIW